VKKARPTAKAIPTMNPHNVKSRSNGIGEKLSIPAVEPPMIVASRLINWFMRYSAGLPEPALAPFPTATGAASGNRLIRNWTIVEKKFIRPGVIFARARRLQNRLLNSRL